jgi:antibiotic biosynthesis monooxygenase (ABM) superfamily enzyme
MELEADKVTVVVTREVMPGRERDYGEWARSAVSASARYGATGHTFSLLMRGPDASGPRCTVCA